MIVLFLDVDGVLCPGHHIASLKEEGTMFIHGDVFYFEKRINQDCLKVLVDLVERLDAYLVVSSMWRRDRAQSGGLRRALLKADIDRDRLLGSTPVLKDESRDKEIRAWLATNQDRDIHAFVAIDDNHITGIPQVNPDYWEGLTEADAELVVGEVETQLQARG